jgi:hypothetical protein
LLKITSPFSFLEPATSAAVLSVAVAVELAPVPEAAGALVLEEPELLHAAAAPITRVVMTAVAARRGQ